MFFKKKIICKELFFGFTFNGYENWFKYFHVLGLFVFSNRPKSIGVLSIIPSGLDTMADSRMALYRCW